MSWLRQSTAATLGFGPFLDQTDGSSILSGLSIAQADVRLKKTSGSWAQKNDATAPATYTEHGWYDLVLNATDTGTLGRLLVAVHATGALPVWNEYEVVPAAVYDALIAGSSGVPASLSATERNAAADALLDRADGIETGLTLRQAHRLETAALAGKLSGAPTGPVIIRNAVADTKARLTSTVDSNGNRTAVTTDVT